MTRSHPTRRRPLPPGRTSAGRRAFTLTEILIALALTALLLVGISRIFGITSTTISSGQALSKAMRQQKAIQTSLSSDINGIGDLGTPGFQSGMLPLVNTRDADYAAPFLSISSSRVAAYATEQAFTSDVGQPLDTTTMTSTIFNDRSEAIRGIDLNNNGVDTDAGESIPLFQYGERNFRVDSLSMFVRGKFQTQTGSDTTSYIDPVSSNEAWVWYGHARVFNSNAAAMYDTNGYGGPGDWITPTSTLFTTAGKNVNNRFADQFRLSRCVGLLVEPQDVKYSTANVVNTSSTPGASRVDRNTVLADSDPTKPLAFAKRNWWIPEDTASGSMNPIDFSANVYKYAVTSAVAGANQHVTVQPPGGASVDAIAQMSISDIFGVGIKELHRRAMYVNEQYNARTTGWRQQIPVLWADRPWVNPFPATLNSTTLAQRQQILADSCSQFIVEYAGDFVGQNPDGTLLGVNPNLPDGVLDFVMVDGVRQTRFYGMPRDVDGNGVIAGTGANRFISADVIPLRDVRGVASNFEQSLPTTTARANYLTLTNEPAGTDPNASNYVCAWGPADAVPDPITGFRALPQLIRIIVDIRDPNGRLKNAVTQEYIFPVRVTDAIAATDR